MLLNDINCDFLRLSVCGFSNDNVLRGRPYGGCAILFRKSLNASFKHIICNSRRMIALLMESVDVACLLINLYMPFEDAANDDSTDEFLVQLTNLNNLIDQFSDINIVIGGDLNVDFNRSATHAAVERLH